MSNHEYKVSKIAEGAKIANVAKRDGTLVPFDSDKIFNAIRKAGEATGEFGEQECYLLTGQVLKVLEHKFSDSLPSIIRLWLMWKVQSMNILKNWTGALMLMPIKDILTAA